MKNTDSWAPLQEGESESPWAGLQNMYFVRVSDSDVLVRVEKPQSKQDIL